MYSCLEDVALDVEKMEGVSMKERIWEYLYDSYLELPIWVYEGLLAVLCIGAVVSFVRLGARKGCRVTLRLLLTEYVVMIFCTTVFFRSVMAVRQYDFHPFWSYGAIQSGESPQLLVENIMNVVVFVPVGIILGSLLRVKGSWFIALLFGLGISVSIETLQFFLKRGFAEVDDVMHNTVGCVIGFMLVVIIKQIWLLQKRYWMS